MQRKKLVSVVLPTYNERGNILKLLAELRRNLKAAALVTEIIVVDDGSPDGTGNAVKKAYRGKRGVRVVIRGEKGLATAVKKGIEMAKGDVILVMDTDFSHDPGLALNLIRWCGKYDVVVGSRYVSGGGMENKTREVFSRMFNELWVRPVLGSSLHDNLSGFFAIKREALKKLDHEKIFFGYGEYFCRLIYYGLGKGLRFKELACFYKERTRGISKSNLVMMFWSYTIAVLGLRLKH